jgi:predicted phosphoribosyltransferase
MFVNRQQAGIILASKIADELPAMAPSDQFIVGLGSGGIIVAVELVTRFGSPLTVFVAETITAVDQPNIELGAVSSSGLVIYADDIECLQTDHGYVGRQVQESARKARESLSLWLEHAAIESRSNIRGKRAIVVAEGVLSDIPCKLAAITMRKLGVRELILATPVIATKAQTKLAHHFDKVVALCTPRTATSFDRIYRDIESVSKQDVVAALTRVSVVPPTHDASLDLPTSVLNWRQALSDKSLGRLQDNRQ